MEQLLEFRNWRVWYDADLNRHIYQQIAMGSPEECACDGCRKFVEQREKFYPVEMRDLLLTLGIDYHKEAEVVTYINPGEAPLSGWYNFVGRVEYGEGDMQYLDRTFRIELSTRRSLVQEAFNALPVVMLEWQSLPKDLQEHNGP